MNKLKVDLENCYGIRELHKEFDFTEHRVYAIYAPNGSMKSSFAQTFKDLAAGTPSKDRLFSTRACNRRISDENGADLPGETTFVIPPYDEVFGHTEKTSTLLVDAKLRKEYEELHTEIDKSKESFLQALRSQSGSKKDLEKEISAAFTPTDDEFYAALVRVKEEVAAQKDAPFAEVAYDTVFDDKVLDFLDTKDFKSAIEDYVKRYNELLAASTYFKKGTFTYYHAATIAKNLADNGFFTAKHSVNLNATDKLEITTQKQLEDLIAKEKASITNDKALRKKYDEIDKLLHKNADIRRFETYLTAHEELLPKMANMDQFKEEVWKSYFKAQLGLYQMLIEQHLKVENRKNEIHEEAAKQRTQWEDVLEIFNERFSVPFTLIAENRIPVMLGAAPMLNLGFIFKDGVDEVQVERTALMQALSTGEKKALYILNIIFEIEARRTAKQETLFIVDDVADSFDYKNKYAIIQYLKDIADEPHFKQIILTHNFDFFRTIESRSVVRYSHCLMASKTSARLALDPAEGIRNVFVRDWKPHFFDDPKKKIASIPFMRNLIEYTHGEGHADYIKLTSLLHRKDDSASITEADLHAIYERLFDQRNTAAKGTRPVVDIIHSEAAACLKCAEGVNFENKIVLSIATRLAAEDFMVRKINDAAFVAAITSDQSQRLLTRFQERFAGEVGNIKTIQRVVLMTPENIHLNSFMYEPILDMSDEHLRKLYADVLALK